MKKSTKVFLSLGAIGVAAGGIGIAIAVNQNSTTNTDIIEDAPSLGGLGNTNNTNRPGFGSNNGIATASDFSFSTFAATPIEVESTTPTVDRVAPTRITKEFKSGWVKANANEGDTVYQSAEYYNQRDFMPILSDSWGMKNYANERSTGAVLNNRYTGWTESKTYFDLAGRQLSMSEYKQWALTYVTYTATPELKAFVESEGKTLPQNFIRMAMLDCELFKNDDKAEKINEYLNYVAANGIKFITIKAATQTQLENIKVPEGTKKLTILDHESWNFNKSKLTSFRGIQIPDTVQELEFYSSTCKKVDPLILSKNTHMIYDHITDLRNYYVDQANFETIDLSNHENLTDEELQQAIDTVYLERQYERAFHGYFLGGYISNLDLSNTGITTLNNVVIPSQADGRFNIAYVKWTSNASSGSASVVITDSNRPSNDSMVGEWYDPTNNAQKVTKLVARTIKSVSVDVAAQEILGQIKKYPNINEVDIKGVALIDGTHDQLIAKVKAALTGPDGQTKEINFIK